MPDVPDTVLRAISFAACRHRGQLRKDDQTPYAAHPMRVLFILRDIAEVRDPETLAAAALHDVIEDTATDRDAIARRFGETVASYVAALSKDTRLPEEERERRYFAQLAEAPLAVKLCKLGDTLDNLTDVTGLGRKAQLKAIKKAERVLGLLDDPLPDECRRLVALIRERVEELATRAPLP